MKLEIERKFLLKSMPIVKEDEVVQIEQWYWKNSFGIWERVRTWFSDKGERRWIHTIKKNISKGVNIEYEKDITESEFKDFINICRLNPNESRFIHKERWIFKDDDLKWEVDKFKECNLVIAEIEIPKKNYPLNVPDFIASLILLEVTDLKQFSNRSLSLKLN